MSDGKQETVADIVREMRNYAKRCREENFGVAPECEEHYNEDDVEYIADRLDAAWKLEREAAEADALVVGGIVAAARTAEKSSAVGNAAAMREALTKIHDLTNALDEECAVDPVEIRDIARAALSAPVRNCDRPECTTSKNAQNVWRKEDGGKTPYYEWLLAPAVERKGEGDA